MEIWNECNKCVMDRRCTYINALLCIESPQLVGRFICILWICFCERKMPAVWLALKRSVQCRSGREDVCDPGGGDGDRCGCSRSIANLKDAVIHGSKRHTECPPICSPRSIHSSEFLTHEVVFDNSTCELKISARLEGGSGGGGVSGVVGVLTPWTPALGHRPGSPVRRTSSNLSKRSSGFGYGSVSARPRSDPYGEAPTCRKCGEQWWEAIEEATHAVTELVEGDSSRKIVEIICRARSEGHASGIDRILKVHNTQKTLAQFEEYRELVKNKASRLPKKHPRCLADGNELLRFHGSTLECSLGLKGSSGLCKSESCRVCRDLRYGFGGRKEIGVFTASSSGKALESIMEMEGRKAMIVCRVIAGRVHRPVENVQEMVGQSEFDSLAGKVGVGVGVHANIEELYLLSHRALLPCFVVIYTP